MELSFGYIADKLSINRKTAVNTVRYLKDSNILQLVESGRAHNSPSTYIFNIDTSTWQLVACRPLVKAENTKNKNMAIARLKPAITSGVQTPTTKNDKNSVGGGVQAPTGGGAGTTGTGGLYWVTESNTTNQTLLESNTSVDFLQKSPPLVKKPKKAKSKPQKKTTEKITFRVFQRDQAVMLSDARRLYPNKNCDAAIVDFIGQVIAKNYKYANYRQAFFNWVRTDRYNQYTLQVNPTGNNNTPKTFFRKQLEEEKSIMDWQYKQFQRMNGETDENILIDQQSEIDF
jgi:hypothetical protein